MGNLQQNNREEILYDIIWSFLRVIGDGSHFRRHFKGGEVALFCILTTCFNSKKPTPPHHVHCMQLTCSPIHENKSRSEGSTTHWAQQGGIIFATTQPRLLTLQLKEKRLGVVKMQLNYAFLPPLTASVFKYYQQQVGSTFGWVVVPGTTPPCTYHII